MPDPTPDTTPAAAEVHTSAPDERPSDAGSQGNASEPGPATVGVVPAPAKPEETPQSKSRQISAALAERKRRLAAEAKVREAAEAVTVERAKSAEVAAKLDAFKTDPLAALEALGLN